MNKKEIAQQFTRQMLEQNPSTPSQSELMAIIQEIPKLYLKTEQMSTQHLKALRLINYSIQDLQSKARDLQHQNEQFSQQIKRINEAMEITVVRFRKSQTVSIWHRYWMVFLMGIIATLITNLIWVLRI